MSLVSRISENDAFSRFKSVRIGPHRRMRIRRDTRTRVNVPEIAQHLARISREHATALTRLRETFATGEATRFLIRGRGGDVSSRPSPPAPPTILASSQYDPLPVAQPLAVPPRLDDPAPHHRRRASPHVVRSSVRPSVVPAFLSAPSMLLVAAGVAATGLLVTSVVGNRATRA